MRIPALCVIAVATIYNGHAAAQFSIGPPNDCDSAITPLERESACTRVIDSGQLDRDALVNALQLRAASRVTDHRDLPGALADTTRGLLLAPGNVVLLGLRAGIYRSMRDYPRAIADLDVLLRVETDPRFRGDYFYSRGFARYQTKAFAAATKDFAEALLNVTSSDDYVRPLALYWQCLAWARLGKASESMEACDMAVAARPGSVVIPEVRGQANLLLRRFDAAMVDFDTVLAKRPDRAIALYGRGLARIGKGDAKGGRADMATAVTIHPPVEKDYEALGLRPR